MGVEFEKGSVKSDGDAEVDGAGRLKDRLAQCGVGRGALVGRWALPSSSLERWTRSAMNAGLESYTKHKSYVRYY